MLDVEILTPKKIELQTKADCLILPTFLGQISILPNHTDLISVLKPGKIKVRTEKKELDFEIEGGILEVAKNKAVILLKRF